MIKGKEKGPDVPNEGKKEDVKNLARAQKEKKR